MESLISCLCVTRKRVDALKRAVSLFQGQTYPNKELVIVYENDDLETKKFLKDIDTPWLTTIEIATSEGLTLGKLRNLAVEKCSGKYFCQWDDDDWYHYKRLEVQMRVIKESHMPSSILLHWLIFNAADNKAYVSCPRPWEGSLLCQKSLFTDDIQYQDAAVGEDTVVIKKLFSKHLIFPMIAPILYIYVYHDKNTWNDEHWQNIFNASTALSQKSSLLIKDILNGKYPHREASELLEIMER